MTGLSCFGAAIALGLIARGGLPPDDPSAKRQIPTSRSIAVILMAFCVGAATLGTIVGLLAIFVAGDVAEPSYGLLAAGPAIAGGVIGLILVARHRDQRNPSISAFAAIYILGITALGGTVALLALFIVEEATKSLTDWPFVILGLVSGGAALAIGTTGASAVRAMQGADEEKAKAVTKAVMSRVVWFQIAYLGASIVAILLIVLG
jgi:hypothetical protein